VVGVSPLISGRPVRGHADACLEAIGVASTTQGVAGLYEDFLDGWLVSEEDAAFVSTGRLVVEARPLLMSSVEAAADIAGAAVDMGMRLVGVRA
jgi:LPPG:FO 2-phospho-L-lactate transferase